VLAIFGLSDSFLQCRGEEEEVCLLERELIFISIPCLHSSLQIIRPVGSCCHKYLKKSPNFSMETFLAFHMYHKIKRTSDSFSSVRFVEKNSHTKTG
jgi:hypothetical protein